MKTSFPKEKIRVVLLEGIDPAGKDLLAAEGFAVESLPKALEGAALAEAVKGAHLLGIRSKTQVRKEALAGAARLLAVGTFCIGTDQVDLAGACSRGVPVFNSPFSNTRSVAELTIAEVVALFRRLFQKSAQLHAGVWDKSAAGSHEVRGKTLGIVGYGHIGSQVSVLAEAMGMRVLYYDIVPRLPLGNARAVRSLDELLKSSDVVTLHVPDTAQTRGMIGREQMARMRQGSMLINNARGKIVDLPALRGALEEGRLSGAALDVFPREPAGKGESFESEIRGVENVILTPHIGGSTEEAQEAIARDVAEKLVKYVNNGSTTGAVNVPQVELAEQGQAEPPAFAEPKAGGTPKDGGTRQHRILHFHRNVPGVLSKMHGVIAELGVNITAEYLQTNRDVGYVVLDVDPTHGEAVLEGLRGIPETIRVRMLF
jgi:D-3-phosphoglycerate dehydrogenase